MIIIRIVSWAMGDDTAAMTEGRRTCGDHKLLYGGKAKRPAWNFLTLVLVSTLLSSQNLKSFFVWAHCSFYSSLAAQSISSKANEEFGLVVQVNERLIEFNRKCVSVVIEHSNRTSNGGQLDAFYSRADFQFQCMHINHDKGCSRDQDMYNEVT